MSVKQKIYDIVKKGLLEQKVFSINPASNYAYRTINGNKRTINMLIVNDIYHEELEGLIGINVISKVLKNQLFKALEYDEQGPSKFLKVLQGHMILVFI